MSRSRRERKMDALRNGPVPPVSVPMQVPDLSRPQGPSHEEITAMQIRELIINNSLAIAKPVISDYLTTVGDQTPDMETVAKLVQNAQASAVCALLELGVLGKADDDDGEEQGNQLETSNDETAGGIVISD